MSSDDMVEQFRTGDVGMGQEALLAGLPYRRKSIPQRAFAGIVAKDVGPSEVGFPVLEDGPEVEEQDVVVGDDTVGRVVARGLQGVLAGPHDPFVPSV